MYKIGNHLTQRVRRGERSRLPPSPPCRLISAGSWASPSLSLRPDRALSPHAAAAVGPVPAIGLEIGVEIRPHLLD